MCVIFAFTHRTLKPKRAARGGKKTPGRFLCIVIYNSSLALKQQLNHTVWTFIFSPSFKAAACVGWKDWAWSPFGCWCSQLIWKLISGSVCSVACLTQVPICCQWRNVPFNSLCGPVSHTRVLFWSIHSTLFSLFAKKKKKAKMWQGAGVRMDRVIISPVFIFMFIGRVWAGAEGEQWPQGASRAGAPFNNKGRMVGGIMSRRATVRRHLWWWGGNISTNKER